MKPKKSVEEMQGYFVPLYEKTWDIKIDSNENNYGPSNKVIEALKNINYREISFYPFYGELSEKIANFYGFNIENIKVTNGADEAIQGIIQTYLEEGESLLTLDVSFDMPIIYSMIQGGNIIKIPFKEKWEFPTDDFVNAIKEKVKIIYLASPNNPTGNIIEKETIEKILEKAENKVVLIDETYANYYGNSYKEYVNKYDNVFIVRSFSKDFALAGLRLGCVISNKNNIDYLKKVISPFSVNAIAIKAGIVALDDAQYFYNIREEINTSKEDLKNFFEKLNAKVYPSNANFLLVDFKEKAEYIYTKLRKENIAVKLFKKGSLLENHLRITIPTKAGVERIKKALEIKPYLVFDMDGVLINAKNSYRVAIEKTYEHFAKETISQEEIQKAKNLGGLNNDWDLTQFLLNKKGINPSYKEIVNVFQDIYWKDGKGVINDENELFDKDLFDNLSKKYNLAIFTGRLRAEAYFALEKFNVKDYFYPILTTDDIPEGKCKPDSYGLNYIKEHTIANNYYYFGDTIDDITCAKNANYVEIGVLPPQDKSEELTQSLKSKGAKFVLQSINELESILEQKNETKC
ncbi:MAG: histidinol-phosphate transaminase [Cyanobacteria bacterium SIG29]|nr:histidinol-phosphate transaminase [Cyanobacteria bacterium SIG29]